MISVLLTILKIIGIAALVILGVILLILLLVLFVPVRYAADGSCLDGGASAEVRVTWLLHAVSAKAAYCKGQAFHMCLRLFGIPVYDNLKPRDRKSKNKKIKSTETKHGRTGEIQAASIEDRPDEKISADDAAEYGLFTDNKTQDSHVEHMEEPKSNIFQKIKQIFVNFVNFFKNIKFTFHKICDTIVKIKDNIKYYLKLLQLDSTKQAFATCRKQFGKVVKKIVPRKFQINLHLGFDDPATMGEVLAVWGMFYPWHQGHVNIQPEFDTAVIEGNFFLKGRISIHVFVQAACILYFNKNIKLLIKRFKRSL